MPPRTKSPAKTPPSTTKRMTRGSATPEVKASIAKTEAKRKEPPKKKKTKITKKMVMKYSLVVIVAGMLGPCLNHAMDIDHLSSRVADLGFPFDAFRWAPLLLASVVAATETAGTLLIISNKTLRGYEGRRIGAAILIPKMLVAVYGHAFVDGFDEKFGSSYASAYTPPGLSYNWAIGASWDCGFWGAGYYLIAYILLAVLK